MIKQKFLSIMRFFYYMLPKFIRVQYLDSFSLLRDFFASEKKTHNDFNAETRVKLVKKIESLGAEYNIIAQFYGRNNAIGSPTIYIDNVSCFRPSLEGKLMDLTVIRLNSVMLVGSTDAVIYKNKMYHQELMSMLETSDLKQPDIFVNQHSSDVNTPDYIVRTKKHGLSIEGLAVSLLKEHSSNYYHCVTEILPKLHEIIDCNIINNKKTSILIDDCMPSQVISMLNIILSSHHSIRYELIKVEKGQKVYCDDLIYCSPLWLSLDNTKHLPDPKKEFFVSQDSLKKVKGQISDLLMVSAVPSKVRKIYLQRPNNRLRKITNILAFERVLYKHGFEFVNSGVLSFKEQYELFFDADIVIGISGASFTNLLFMKPGSKAVIISPSAQCTNYYIFQPLADVSEVELVHLLSEPNGDFNHLHGDASVNVEELELFLSQIVV